MSEQNGKVCYNCRHKIETKDKRGDIKNTCDIDESYISYVKSMTGWCRHWAKNDIMKWIKKLREQLEVSE